MFVFQPALPQSFSECSDICKGGVSVEESPDGIVLRGPVMEADNFFNESLPPVGSVVNPLGQRIPGRIICSVLRGVKDLSGLDTAPGAHHSVVFCY